MPFGFDDLFYLIAAISAGNQLVNPPEGPENTIPGGGAGKQAFQGAGPFESFVPETGAPGEAIPGIDLSAQSAVLDQTAKALAAQGPPPTVPLQPAQPPAPVQPPVGAPGGGAGPPVSRQGTGAPAAAPPKSIGEILAASPEALASVANLLGLNQQDGGTRPAPVAGGGLGAVVPGFQLPQVPAIGQLLAQIPRLR